MKNIYRFLKSLLILLNTVITRKILIFLIFIVGITFFYSCRHIDCPRYQEDMGSQLAKDTVPLYNVEFKSYMNINSKIYGSHYRINNIKSYIEPKLDKRKDGTPILIIYEIEYKNAEMIYDFKSNEFIEDIRDYKHEILLESISYESCQNGFVNISEIDEIVRMTSMSDPLKPPKEIDIIQCLPDCECCPRDRECIRDYTGFVDKIELRLMGGYRPGAEKGVFYPGDIGGTFYEKETFGFDRGGTDFISGLELSFFWNANYIPKSLGFDKETFERNNFALGVMTGIWPVDGSIFIPLSFHPRYTFNYDVADRKNCECDAWYVFGDFGVPIDPTGNVPIYCENGICKGQFAYFYGFGFGRDWWISRCSDFSIDIGYRRTKTPLPKFDCCGNPFRISDNIFIRFGITW